MISLSCLHALNIPRTKGQHFTAQVKLGGRGGGIFSKIPRINIYEISKPAFCLQEAGCWNSGGKW